MRKTVIGMTITSLVLTSTLLAGCGKSDQPAAAPQAKTVPVEVMTAKQGTLDKGRVLTGTAQPLQQANIVPKVSAKVTSIQVKVGQKVSAGDVLFRLDDKDLRNAVAQAQQTVALSRASLAQAQLQQRNGIDSAQTGVNQANNGLSQANAAYEQAKNSLEQAEAGITRAQQGYNDAKTNADRTAMLFQQGAVTKQNLEQAQTQLKNAEIALKEAQISKQNADASRRSAEQSRKNAQSSMKTAQDQVSNAKRGEAIEVSRQQLNQAELNLKIAQDNLNNAVVTAPISGTIGAINGEVGDFSSPQSPFMILANLETAKAVINVPENMINLFTMGQAVNIDIPSVKLQRSGKVASISPINQQSKGYPVTIEVPNQDGKIKGGMILQVSVLTPDTKRGIVVPTTALLSADGKSYVYVAQGDKPVRKTITIVEQNSDQSLVNGLAAGDQVVVKGQSLISDDAKLSVKKSQ